MEDEDGETLEGVGDGEDNSDPAEGLGEVEEAGDPGETEETDEGETSLELGDDLLAGVQVVVPTDGHPGHSHGEDEDDDVEGDDDGHRSHEGPEETVLIVNPAVLRRSVTLETEELVTEE